MLAVAWATLSGGLDQLPSSVTIGQRVETAVQLACGVLSLLGVLACFRWRRWGPPILAAWAVTLSAAAGMSSLVWGPPSVASRSGLRRGRAADGAGNHPAHTGRTRGLSGAPYGSLSTFVVTCCVMGIDIPAASTFTVKLLSESPSWPSNAPAVLTTDVVVPFTSPAIV